MTPVTKMIGQRRVSCKSIFVDRYALAASPHPGASAATIKGKDLRSALRA
jgi:hypothetical protein